MIKHKRHMWLGALSIWSLLAGVGSPALILADELPPSASAPDLIVENMAWTPEIPSIGNTVTFTVTIKNQGNGQAGSSRVAYYIDDAYQSSAPVNPINPGATATETFTWKAQAGSHIIKAVADHDGGVSESDEANNDEIFTFSVLAPDLIIETITGPPVSPSIGEKVDFTVTIRNQGSSRAGASSVDFYVDGASRGYRSILGLDAGAARTETFTWSAQAGFHAIEAIADVLNQVSESDEDNNIKKLNYSTSAPDLIIDTITWSPVDFLEGTNVVFTVTIKNQGIGKAEYSHVVCYVDDTYPVTSFVNPISPGATATSTFDWKAQSGFHTVKAIADSDSVILESDETNNDKTVALPALAPDLIVQGITSSPASPIVGQYTDFKVSITNQGKSKASISTVYLFIDGANRLQQDIYEIDTGVTVTVTFMWMPRSDTHTIKAVADGDNDVNEGNESNNTKTITLAFSHPALSDLVVRDVVWSPQNPSIGDTVTFNATIKNQGSGQAGICFVAYYIDDTRLTSNYINPINAGATATTACTWAAQAGSHVIKVVVDSNSVIPETKENNNENSATVSVSAPDLVVRSVTFSPVSPSPGDTVTLTVAIENQGNNRAGRSYVAYYVDGSSRGYDDIPEMDAGAAVTKTFTWTAQADSHAVKAVADAENQIPESNEGNNEQTVTVPAPDLVIDTITWSPLNPSKDDTVTFGITVKNQSNGSALPASVYFDIDGSSQGYEDIQAMAAGATVTKAFVWKAQVGNHTVKAIADGLNQIFESRESNNEKTLSFTVGLPAASAPPTPANPVTSPEQQGVNANLDNQNKQVSPGQDTVLNVSRKSTPARSSEKETWLFWWLILTGVVLGGTVIAVILRSRQRPR